MLDPRNVNLGPDAFGSMILVGIQDAYAYDDDGKRTDVVTAVRCNIVLPAYDYERLVVKLPTGTAVDSNLIGRCIAFSDFTAKVYAYNGKLGYTAKATGITAAKA